MNLFNRLILNGLQLAKGDHDTAMAAINNQRTAQTGQQNQLRDQFTNQYSNAYKSDQDLKGTVTAGYKNYLDPEYGKQFFGDGSAGGGNLADILKGIGGVSGGIDPSHITNMGVLPYEGYKKLSEGLSPEFRAKFEKSMGDLDTGIGSYKNFIDTGGFSPEDIAVMRAQAVNPTRQLYQNIQDEMTTAQNRAGLNTSGGNVAALRAASDAADKIGNINTTTEANLAQMKQQGKEFGTTGLTQASLGQAQARTAVEQLDSQMKEAGLGGMTDIEKSRLQAELSNAQLNQGASSGNASIAMAKAGLLERQGEFLAGLPMEALKGMTGLYGTTPADTALAGNEQLQLQNLSQTGNQNLINSQIGASQIPGNFQQAMGNVGSVFKNVVSPIAGAVTGGLTNFIPSFNRMNPYSTNDWATGVYS